MKAIGTMLGVLIIAGPSMAASDVEPVLVAVQRTWWEFAIPWLQLVAAILMIAVALAAWKIAGDTRDTARNQLYTAFIREIDEVEKLTNRFRLYLNLVEMGQMQEETSRLIESYIDWYGDTGVAFFIPDVRDHVHREMKATSYIFGALRGHGKFEPNLEWCRKVRKYLTQETPKRLGVTENSFRDWQHRRRKVAPKGMQMESDGDKKNDRTGVDSTG